MSDFISVNEIAQRFGISRMTVTRWADDGILPCLKLPTGTRRFRRADIEAMLKEAEGDHH